MNAVAGRMGFLSTKVGRQTLATFLTAAMLPVLATSLLGVWYVRRSLESEAIERVQRTSKSAVMIVINRLNQLAERVDSTVHGSASGTPLHPSDAAHLREGRPLLRLADAAPGVETGDPSLQLLRQTADGVLMSRTTEAEAFWAALQENPDLDRTSLCLFQVINWRRVYCSPNVDTTTVQVLRALAISDTTHGAGNTRETAREAGQRSQTVRDTGDGSMGRMMGGPMGGSGSRSVGQGKDALLVSLRDVYLRYELGAAEWRLVTAESRASALAPARSITTSLALVNALALVSAFLLAHSQIRRSTAPLAALSDATERVAAGDMETLVTITTRDEYGALGTAFNSMTSALSQQLNLLHRLDDVDKATLRTRQVEAIVSATLRGFVGTPQFINPSVALVGDERAPLLLTQWGYEGRTGQLQSRPLSLTSEERRFVLANPRQYRAVALPDALARSAHGELRPSPQGLRIVLPLLREDELLGVLSCDTMRDVQYRVEDLAALRRIADRVALGVSNVRLVNQLDAMSTGTLRAFARAIDANSAWTAGHSERVTHLAMALGQALDLSRDELSTLYRGGLMHDIGKIGIPASILDKQGKLSPEERTIIEQHPTIGARILAPIAGFSDALPIVLSHHERMDGQGYPDHLVGSEIPWLARVLSVADVFDALVSDRPYRAGLSHRAAISMIEAQTGSSFDPQVVDALLRLEPSSALHSTPASILDEYSVAGLVTSPTIHDDAAQRSSLETLVTV